MGRHASRRNLWFNPLPWAVAAATAVFLLLFLRHLPCLQIDARTAVNPYQLLCYSDIQTAFLGYGLGRGSPPLTSSLSPIVALVMLTARLVAELCGLPVGPGVTAQQQIDASLAFFGVTTVALFACFLVAVVAMGQVGMGVRAWDAVLLAGSPVVLAVGLIDWSLIAVSLCVVALALQARGRGLVAGVIVGVAMCASTMAWAVWLGILIAVWRREGPRRLVVFAAASVGICLAVHLPLLVHNLGEVYSFYHHEIHRESGYGSVWYLMAQLGLGIRQTGSLAFALLMLVLGCLTAWIYLSGRRPRASTMVAVVLLVSIVTGPVFSPQMGLWVLLAVLLVRPRRRELALVTITQVAYCLAIWGWLGGALHPAQQGPYVLYWAAIAAWVAAASWVLVLAVGEVAGQGPARGIRAGWSRWLWAWRPWPRRG